MLGAPTSARADGPGNAVTVETEPRWNVIVGGATLFGAPYFAGVFATMGADVGHNTNFDALYIPIVGPFITAGQLFSASSGTLLPSFNNGVGAIFIVDGIAQVAGAAMFITGLAVPRKRRVDNPSIHVQPVVGRTMTGVGLGGTF